MKSICQRIVVLNILAIACTLFCSLSCYASRTIFIVLGAPGAGKGTLTEQCIKQLGFQELSTGKLCRQEIALGSEKGKLINQFSMSTGMTPDYIIVEMVETWLATHQEDRPVIFDGYPRTKHQAELLTQVLKEKFPEYTVRVFLLSVSDHEELIKRIANRLVCENKTCQAVYNREFLKNSHNGHCDACGGYLITRPDDQEHIVRERLRSFDQHNLKLSLFMKA